MPTPTRPLPSTLFTAAACFLCAACGTQERPNGKSGVLAFSVHGVTILRSADGSPEPKLAEGLSATVLLPREVTVGETRHTFGFEGTTLEVGVPEGLTASEPELLADGWRFDLTCVEARDGALEVRVRVLEGETARYEDAFDTACRKGASFQLVAPEHAVYFTGAELVTGADIKDAAGARLRGRGLKVAPKSAEVVRIIEERTDDLVLQTVGRGSGPILLAGGLEAVLDVTVQTEAEPWALELVPLPSGELLPGQVGFRAVAKTPAGEEIGGLGACAFTLAGNPVEPAPADCRFVANAEEVGNAVLCVTARTRNTCRDVQ